jgi:hypothetical protein
MKLETESAWKITRDKLFETRDYYKENCECGDWKDHMYHIISALDCLAFYEVIEATEFNKLKLDE